MKKLIVHIGYPKTATTSMQENLFTELMQDRKIEYLNHVNIKKTNLSNLYCKKILQYITGSILVKDFEKELYNISTIEENITLLSAETISIFHKSFSWANLNSKAIENIERIKEVFSSVFDEIQILMTVRAQENIIPSFYAQNYHHIKVSEPKYGDIHSWFRSNFINQANGSSLPFNFNLMYKKCSEIFGEDNTHVLLFEDLSKEPNKIYKALSKIFNVSELYVEEKFSNRIQNKTRKNFEGKKLTNKPTMNTYLITYLGRPLQQILPERYTKRFKNIYRKYIPEDFLKIEFNFETVVGELKEEEINLIHKQYDELNYEFLKSCDISERKMKQYNYIR